MNNKANGVWQASTAVDNTSTLYVDALLSGSIQGQTPTTGTTFEIWLYGTTDGTNFTAGCSGTDGVYTADGEEDELCLAKVITVTNDPNHDYVWGPVSVAGAMGLPCLPSKWGVVFRNTSAATTHATGAANYVKFCGVK
jgi:hypothetical protein